MNCRANWAGRDCLVDIFTRRSHELDPEIDESIGENVRVIYLKAGPLLPWTPEEHYDHLSEFTAALMAFAALRNLRYDIVYSHYWLSGWVAAKLKEAWGTRFVHMYHTLGHMKKRIEVSAGYQPDVRIMTEMQISAVGGSHHRRHAGRAGAVALAVSRHAPADHGDSARRQCGALSRRHVCA